MAIHVMLVLSVTIATAYLLSRIRAGGLWGTFSYICSWLVGAALSLLLAFGAYPGLGLIEMGVGDNNSHLAGLFFQGALLALVFAGIGVWWGRRSRKSLTGTFEENNQRLVQGDAKLKRSPTLVPTSSSDKKFAIESGSLWLIAFCIVFSLASFAFGLFLGADWQPKSRLAAGSFEECVLNEMRGQSRELRNVARKLCRSRFPAPAIRDVAGSSTEPQNTTVIPMQRLSPDPVATLPEGFVIDEE